MHNLVKKRLLLSAAMTGLATPAMAQETPSQTPAAQATEVAETIIVTARRREENLIDVPVPVTVTTAAQLERDQVYTITDLQRTTPALEVSQTFGGESNGGARLRGLGTGVFNQSVSPSVAFVVDQVPQGNLAFPLLFDLAQVEVLRGPQGTLFGQGASAGVINVSTVAPRTDKIAVDGGVEISDKGTLGSEVSELIIRGGINLPLSSNAAIRVAGHYKREKGLMRNVYLDKTNVNEDYGLRARLLLQPTDRLEINLSAERVENQQDGYNFFNPVTAPTSQASLTNYSNCGLTDFTERAEFYCEDSPSRIRSAATGFAGRIDYELSDALSLTSVTAYRLSDREIVAQNFSRRIGFAARQENQETESKQFSQELRLTYESDALNLVGGAVYSRFRAETTPLQNIPLDGTALGERTGFSVCNLNGTICFVPPELSYENTRNTTIALFADATYSLTDQLDLFGGIRYTDYKNTTGVGSDSVVAERTSRITDTNVSGRVGASFKPSSSSTIYGSVSRGYKPPALVVPTIADRDVVELEPEISTAFEIGGKVEVERVQLSANAFYSKVENFQNQSSVFDEDTGALISVAENISKVKSKGFELGAFGRVGRHLSLNAGYQFNIVKYPKLGTDGRPFLGNDNVVLGGKQFVNAPKHKFTLSGEFTQPVSDSLEVYLNANLVYKSKVLLGQYGSDAFRYPAHEMINTGFGLRDANGAWRAGIIVRNLTKEREPTAYLAGDLGGSPDGGIRAWPVSGLTTRVVSLSLDFNF